MDSSCEHKQTIQDDECGTVCLDCFCIISSLVMEEPYQMDNLFPMIAQQTKRFEGKIQGLDWHLKYRLKYLFDALLSDFTSKSMARRGNFPNMNAVIYVLLLAIGDDEYKKYAPLKTPVKQKKLESWVYEVVGHNPKVTAECDQKFCIVHKIPDDGYGLKHIYHD